MATTHFNGPVQSTNGFIGTLSGALTSVTQLTDNSGGTANNTVELVPDAVASVGADTSAATVVSVNASIAAIKNDIADLAAKVNAIIAALD